MLHTINQSPFRTSTLETCSRFLQADDPVLFLEDGVYSVAGGSRFTELVEKIIKKNKVYVLTPDLEARGIQQILTGVTKIGYDGFVELVEKHQVNSWF
jgi:tRNA 2-thiouridine synthesizing protein B